MKRAHHGKRGVSMATCWGRGGRRKRVRGGGHACHRLRVTSKMTYKRKSVVPGMLHAEKGGLRGSHRVHSLGKYGRERLKGEGDIRKHRGCGERKRAGEWNIWGGGDEPALGQEPQLKEKGIYRRRGKIKILALTKPGENKHPKKRKKKRTKKGSRRSLSRKQGCSEDGNDKE